MLFCRLKKEKEEERVREEQISEQLVEPRDPVTGETSTEALEREEQDKQFIRRTIREHERRAQKSKEMERCEKFESVFFKWCLYVKCVKLANIKKNIYNNSIKKNEKQIKGK
ncbi:hypothetical protein DPMN_068061 [Dreissena polymorpha]|uniref:Uncharacterized protein n=1 Tax=Dreissena polymorpha TaxID=45954 RepID=A0A9D3Z0V9_DREPO|nr:hypothetical protein DPMN_068061 [Dreissena polymorpha]